MSIRTFPLKSLTLTYRIFPICEGQNVNQTLAGKVNFVCVADSALSPSLVCPLKLTAQCFCFCDLSLDLIPVYPFHPDHREPLHPAVTAVMVALEGSGLEASVYPGPGSGGECDLCWWTVGILHRAVCECVFRTDRTSVTWNVWMKESDFCLVIGWHVLWTSCLMFRWTCSTWNMLSSPLLPPLEDPPGFELSPLFGFLDGFSDWLVFFLLALRKKQITTMIIWNIVYTIVQ